MLKLSKQVLPSFFSSACHENINCTTLNIKVSVCENNIIMFANRRSPRAPLTFVQQDDLYMKKEFSFRDLDFRTRTTYLQRYGKLYETQISGAILSKGTSPLSITLELTERDTDFLNELTRIEIVCEEKFAWPAKFRSVRSNDIELELTSRSEIVNTSLKQVEYTSLDIIEKIMANITLQVRISKIMMHYCIDLVIKQMYIISTNLSEPSTDQELPDLMTFRKQKLAKKIMLYEHVVEPDKDGWKLMNYMLVEHKEFGIVTARMTDFVPDNKLQGILVPSRKDISSAWIKANSNLHKSYDNNMLNHYSIVLTYSDQKFQNSVNVDINNKESIKYELGKYLEEFLRKRFIDVRGQWYDEGENRRRPHYNLHIVSSLPLAYFLELLDHWRTAIGQVTATHIYEPIGWRLYASRNHHLLTNSAGRYRSALEAREKLILYENLFERSGMCKVPSEIAIKIMEYLLYD
jgi:hypothetical protein